MQGDAPGFEQALVGGIADQGVLEQIGRVGRRAAAEDQLGGDQALHRVGQLGLRQGGKGGDGAVVEAAADDGGGLGHLLHRLQAIEPRHQRVVQRCGDRQRAQRSVEVKRVGTLAQHARSDDRLRHLLDEQRHPSVRAAISSSNGSGKLLPRVMCATIARIAARVSRFRASRVTTGWLPKDATKIGRAVIMTSTRALASHPAPARSAPGSWDRSSARPRSPTTRADGWRARSADR